MSVQELLDMRNCQSQDSYLSLLLAFHCAPIIKGSKVANIITVSFREAYKIQELIEGTGIRCFFLKKDGGKAILYLYRQNMLFRVLYNEETRAFLRQYGYRDLSIGGTLTALSRRISIYEGDMGHGISATSIDFPHEIGIFLGYPIDDVKEFVKQGGENYIYLGYWKVYQDVNRAKQLFARFDSDRELAFREIMEGKSIREICN